jgi:hypothetical protein
MGPAHKAILEEIRKLAEPAGAEVEYKSGTKHSFVVVRFPDTFRKITMSNGTKNIRHQLDWARQNAKRALREMGRP